ncbi:hypothetical protein FQR65_LT06315 [Abscondita terminalis]|nr:hypothetical protein FQR65_LT06315 [Abscondita terminalis]
MEKVFIFPDYASNLVIMLKRKVVLRIFDYLEDETILPNFDRSVNEETSMKNTIALIQKCNFGAVVVLTIVYLLTITCWYFTRFTKWPYGVFWEIVNYDVSVVLNCIFYLVVCHNYFGLHAMFITLLYHIQLHLNNLQSCIETLVNTEIQHDLQNLTSVPVNHFDWKHTQFQVKKIVSYHVTIYNISKDIDEAFRYCYLLCFVIITIILCFTVYDIVFASTATISYLLQIVYTFILIFTILTICYHGNQVTVKSLEVADTCYELNFIGSDIRLQKILIILMQRSQRPIIMRIGKFAPLSFATAVGILKAAYSYLMLLQNMYEKK